MAKAALAIAVNKRIRRFMETILSPAEAGSFIIVSANPRLTPWARILSRSALISR